MGYRRFTPDKHPDLTYDDQGRVRVSVTSGAAAYPGLAADPLIAQQNMGKQGWCEEDVPCPELGGRSNPKITLDDGTVIWGYQCWWAPVTQQTTEVH